MAARNMWRIEINIHEEKELCVKLVIYKKPVSQLKISDFPGETSKGFEVL